jgi:hypothetical protein
VARRHPLPHLTRQERRAEPLLRQTGLPVVVAGSTVPNPYGRRATLLLDGFEGVAQACEQVAGRSDLGTAAPTSSGTPGRRMNSVAVRDATMGRCTIRLTNE